MGKNELSVRVIKTVLAKAGKTIDYLSFTVADLRRLNMKLKRQLDAYKVKRARKQPVNQNLKFLSQFDIQLASNGPPVPVWPANEPIDDQIASSAPQNDRPDFTTAFAVAIANLTSGGGTVRST